MTSLYISLTLVTDDNKFVAKWLAPEIFYFQVISTFDNVSILMSFIADEIPFDGDCSKNDKGQEYNIFNLGIMLIKNGKIKNLWLRNCLRFWN